MRSPVEAKTRREITKSGRRTGCKLKIRCLFSRSDVEGLLSLRECIDELEKVFRLQGEGKIPRSEILGVKTPNGGLHVKTAF